MAPVYVACIYGLHQGLQDHTALTDKILEAIFLRADQMQMPAIICGDFNTPLSQLLTWETMKGRHWSDAALIQQSKDGLEPRNTYMESSRIDFILVNRFAARALDSFWVSDLPVTDHRQLFASFSWQKASGLETVWRMPNDLRHAAIPEEKLQAARVPVAMIEAFQNSLQSGKVDEAWEKWTDAIEYTSNRVALDVSGKPLPRAFQGKSKPKFVHRNAQRPYMHKGRDDTLQMDAVDLGVNFRQRVRQIRRLDAFRAQLRCNGPLPMSRIQEARKIWSAVLQAPGFHPGFPRWCVQQFDTCCPLDIPSLDQAMWLRKLLADQVPKWRAVAEAARLKEVRRTFSEDWTAGGRKTFSAIKQAQHPPVDAIDRIDRISVRAKRKGMALFRLAHEDSNVVGIAQMWTQGQAKGYVASVEGGVVSVRMVHGIIKSGFVEVATTCQDPVQSLDLACRYWSSFWNDEHSVDLQDEDVVALQHSLPDLEQIDPTISAYELKNALRSLPIAKARGMDAVTNWELKNLCGDLQAMLLQLLNGITLTGVWPTNLTKARMHLIRKTDAAGDITSTRPICILPNVYRLWGKIMTTKCFNAILPHIPPSLCGSVPGRSATDIAMQLQISLEKHILQGRCIYGASLDLHKAFNTLNRDLLKNLCRKLGLGPV